MLAATAIAVPAPYRALISAATASHASCLRLEITTLAPCSASSNADALPLPFDDPVMTATFPVRSNSDIQLSSTVSAPAKAGAQSNRADRSWPWVPAFAGKQQIPYA